MSKTAIVGTSNTRKMGKAKRSNIIRRITNNSIIKDFLYEKADL
jgi:hypothetical protein